jgi:hypothetical protein
MAPNTWVPPDRDRRPTTEHHRSHRVENGLRDENHGGVDDHGHDPDPKARRAEVRARQRCGRDRRGRSSAAGSATGAPRRKLGEISRDVDSAARTRRAIDGLPAALRTCPRHRDGRILAHRATRECARYNAAMLSVSAAQSQILARIPSPAPPEVVTVAARSGACSRKTCGRPRTCPQPTIPPSTDTPSARRTSRARARARSTSWPIFPRARCTRRH